MYPSAGVSLMRLFGSLIHCTLLRLSWAVDSQEWSSPSGPGSETITVRLRPSFYSNFVSHSQ